MMATTQALEWIHWRHGIRRNTHGFGRMVTAVLRDFWSDSGHGDMQGGVVVSGFSALRQTPAFVSSIDHRRTRNASWNTESSRAMNTTVEGPGWHADYQLWGEDSIHKLQGTEFNNWQRIPNGNAERLNHIHNLWEYMYNFCKWIIFPQWQWFPCPEHWKTVDTANDMDHNLPLLCIMVTWCGSH